MGIDLTSIDRLPSKLEPSPLLLLLPLSSELKLDPLSELLLLDDSPDDDDDDDDDDDEPLEPSPLLLPSLLEPSRAPLSLDDARC